MPVKDNAKVLVMKTDDVQFSVKGSNGYSEYQSFGQIKKGELKITFDENKAIEFLDGSELSSGYKFKLETSPMQYEDFEAIKALNGKSVRIKISGTRQGVTGKSVIYLRNIVLKTRIAQINPFTEGETFMVVSATKDVMSEFEVLSSVDPKDIVEEGDLIPSEIFQITIPGLGEGHYTIGSAPALASFDLNLNRDATDGIKFYGDDANVSGGWAFPIPTADYVIDANKRKVTFTPSVSFGIDLGDQIKVVY